MTKTNKRYFFFARKSKPWLRSQKTITLPQRHLHQSKSTTYDHIWTLTKKTEIIPFMAKPCRASFGCWKFSKFPLECVFIPFQSAFQQFNFSQFSTMESCGLSTSDQILFFWLWKISSKNLQWASKKIFCQLATGNSPKVNKFLTIICLESQSLPNG